MRISLLTRSSRFHIECYGKFNVILGNSGTHKTEFIKCLQKAKQHIGILNVVADDNKPIDLSDIVLLTNDTLIAGDYHDVFKRMHGSLVVVDEESELFHYKDFSSVVQEADAYFIFVTRNVMGWLPISVDSVYRLEYDHRDIINVPAYAKENSDLTHVNAVEYILTEDSCKQDLGCHYNSIEQFSFEQLASLIPSYSKSSLPDACKDACMVQYPVSLLRTAGVSCDDKNKTLKRMALFEKEDLQ